MTHASFYILGADSEAARQRFVQKLVRQSIRKGLDVHIHVADESHARTLDEALWADDEGFIAHDIEVTGEPSPAPVGIGWQDPAARHGVLVNLGGPLPEWFSHFDRVVEVVIQSPSVLAETRANWQHLKHLGYPLTQHDLRS